MANDDKLPEARKYSDRHLHKVQTYGSNPHLPIKSNNQGHLEVVSAPDSSVNVSATNLDIRKLSSSTDSIAVVGNIDVVATNLDTRKLSSSTDSVTVVGKVDVAATDLDIRKLSSSTDSVTVTGKVDVAATDLDIRKLSSSTDSVTVAGKVDVAATDLDIRKLSSSTDSISVTGAVNIRKRLVFRDRVRIYVYNNPVVIDDYTVSDAFAYQFYVESNSTANAYVSLMLDINESYVYARKNIPINKNTPLVIPACFTDALLPASAATLELTNPTGAEVEFQITFAKFVS